MTLVLMWLVTDMVKKKVVHEYSIVLLKDEKLCKFKDAIKSFLPRKPTERHVLVILPAVGLHATITD